VIVAGSEPSVVEVYRFDGGKVGTALRLQLDDAVSTLAIGPRGRQLIIGFNDARLDHWDLENPASGATPLVGHQMRRDFRGKPQGISQAFFDGTGRWLITAAGDGRALAWDLDATDGVPTVLLAESASWTPGQFSSDGRWLALPMTNWSTKTWGGRLAVWRRNGTEFRRSKVLDYQLSEMDDPTILGFASDGRVLVTASTTHVVLWDLADPASEPVRLPGYGRDVSAVAVAPQGAWLASADWNHALKLWRSADSTGPMENSSIGERPNQSSVSALAVDPQGKHIATGGAFGTVIIWDVDRPASPPREIQAHGPHAWITELEFSSDSGQLLTAADDGGLRLWTLAEDDIAPMDFKGYRGPIMRALFSPDGRSLVTAGRDSLVSVWRTTDPTARDHPQRP
jgi:WD40 repeat protein